MKTCECCGLWVDAADGGGEWRGDCVYCEDCAPIYHEKNTEVP